MTETTVTYGRLESALLSLGFTRHLVEGGVLYLEPSNDAHLMMPLLAADVAVRPHHLAAARLTVVGRGVAAADEFERALEKAA